jgi:hypothetical protein
MSDMAFTWRGQSSDDYGIVVTALPPVNDSGQTHGDRPPCRDIGRAACCRTAAWDEQLITIRLLSALRAGRSQRGDDRGDRCLAQGDDYLMLSDQPG